MISSFVITGFLGSGKSTMLINSVQKYFDTKKVAVIVNEFGEIGIDGKVLHNVYSQVLEISQGCICCQMSQEFENGIAEIVDTYNPEIIFIESSGVSEPLPIFFALHSLGISVEGILCLIDAKNFDTYKESTIVKNQIGGSNIIIINKVDLVSPSALDTLKQEIRSIKEHYDIKNELTGQKIFKTHLFYETTYGNLDKEIFDGMYEMVEIQVIARSNDTHSNTQINSITQSVAYLREGVTFQEIQTMLHSLPKSIYRVKGIVWTSDTDHPILINYAFGDISHETLPLQDIGQSVLIFIGKDISKDIAILSRLFGYLLLPRFRVLK